MEQTNYTPQQFKGINATIMMAEQVIHASYGIKLRLAIKTFGEQKSFTDKETLADAICSRWGKSFYEVRHNGRKKEYCEMRRCLSLILPQYFYFDFKRLANFLSRGCHTSAMHWQKTAIQMIRNEDKMFMEYFTAVQDFFIENPLTFNYSQGRKIKQKLQAA